GGPGRVVDVVDPFTARAFAGGPGAHAFVAGGLVVNEGNAARIVLQLLIVPAVSELDVALANEAGAGGGVESHERQGGGRNGGGGDGRSDSKLAHGNDPSVA